MGLLGDPLAVDPLLRTLLGADGEPDTDVVEALVRIRDPRAVGPLLELQKEKAFPPGSVLPAALVALGDLTYRDALQEAMRGTEEDTRRSALWSLARLEPHVVDRVLFSSDLDALAPGIDPAEAIEEGALAAHAAAVRLPVDEVRRRFAELAARYPLSLSWTGPRSS
ncbi:HEAT repeat domain-containing protein [Streptomyces sp. NPDC059629]|uniref:HEAT repeat domain-containing protein n=1 Tax=Streptomyces sp. NPDC059629 TaxID=3346889 RepID=UPI0036AB98A6